MSPQNLPLDRWRYLVDVGVWPKRAQFDPIGWISNFTEEEIPLALRLLDGFTFFSQELVAQMFRSAFLNISQRVVKDKQTYHAAQAEWTSFIDSLLVVRVTGETPSDADSGFTFARLSRDILDIPEQQIVSPEDALAKLASGRPFNILFVDDFVGSGNQFCETWERKYKVGDSPLSFSAIAAASTPAAQFFYSPVICTELGKKEIAQWCPGVEIIPAHFFGSKHSAISSDSEIWREDMQTEGPEFVRLASVRAGIPDLDGGVGCWRGFHKLGLALAFQHGYPDATLPLFYSTANNWKPLLKKGIV